MDIVNIRVTFEDKPTGTKNVKTYTRSKDTFEKMKQTIGQVWKEHSNGITWLWTVMKVEQI